MIEDLKIKFQDMGGATDLLCPRCGADLLHQSAVTVFDRAEDEDTVVRTTVADGTASMNLVSNSTENPSSRRHGLAIRFWCESCCPEKSHDVIELTIAQHKGSTEIAWRYTERKPA